MGVHWGWIAFVAGQKWARLHLELLTSRPRQTRQVQLFSLITRQKVHGIGDLEWGSYSVIRAGNIQTPKFGSFAHTPMVPPGGFLLLASLDGTFHHDISSFASSPRTGSQHDRSLRSANNQQTTRKTGRTLLLPYLEHVTELDAHPAREVIRTEFVAEADLCPGGMGTGFVIGTFQTIISM
jgi:hypothetical protein